jgi:hypothetical protein
LRVGEPKSPPSKSGGKDSSVGLREIGDHMPTRTTPTIDTIERLVDEVQAWASRVNEIRDKMSRLQLGSQPWVDLLPGLNVELDWLEEKSKHAAQAIDEFIDGLPDDE